MKWYQKLWGFAKGLLGKISWKTTWNTFVQAEGDALQKKVNNLLDSKWDEGKVKVKEYVNKEFDSFQEKLKAKE